MPKATLKDGAAIRAILHSFPGSQDAFDPLFLKMGRSGLEILGLDRSQCLLGKLVLTAEAFDERPDGEGSIGVIHRDLIAALETSTLGALSAADVSVSLDLENPLLTVTVRAGLSTLIRRGLREIDPSIRALPRLPNYDEQPRASRLKPYVLDLAMKAFHNASGVDAVDVAIQSRKISFTSWPDATVASFMETHADERRAGKTRMTASLLEEAGGFGSGKGVDASTLEISLVPKGNLRAVFALPKGTMTYWVAPRAEGD